MTIYDIDGNVLDLNQKRSDIEWKRGTLSNTGSIEIDGHALDTLCSAVILAKEALIISVPEEYRIKIAYYKTLNITGFQSVTAWSAELNAEPDNFIVISLKKANGSAVDISDSENVTIDGDYDVYSYSEKPKSLDVYYKIERMRWTSEIIFDILRGFPLTNGNASAKETVYGVPYSTATHTEGIVNIDVSMYTYLSCVRNPNSVIYTDIESSSVRRAYYGIDCSGLVNGGFGLHDNIVTSLMRTLTDLFDVISDPMDIQLGDLVWKTGHVAPIVYIEKDKFGRIVWVGINEGRSPYAQHHLYFWSEFLNRIATDPATLRRYKGIDDVMFDSPLDYQFRGDPALNYTFPDIMPALGDKKTVLTGTSVAIQVLDSTGYSSIKVYRDGTLIDTKSSVVNFTIVPDTVGKYEVRMEGTGKSSSCYFNAVSLSLSINGNVATFTADGVTPYTLYSTLHHGGEGGDKQNIHFLTDSEIRNGSATIADIVSAASSANGCVKLKAYDEFGTVFVYVNY